MKVRKLKHAAVKQHVTLHKTESAMIIQIRTGRIDLAAFLNKAQMPRIESPACQCGWARKITAHVIEHCLCFAGVRHQIADPRTG